MKHINEVRLIGVIGSVEATTSAKGNLILKFSLANNSYKKVDDGFEQSTEWFNITSFGDLAQRMESKLCKGDTVMITGKLVNNQWEQDGVKRSSLNINAFSIDILLAKADRKPYDNSAADKPYTSNTVATEIDEPPF